MAYLIKGLKSPWSWTLAACVVLTGWALPPEQRRQSTRWMETQTAMDAARRGANQARARLNEELRIIRVADSLRVVMQDSEPVVLDIGPAIRVRDNYGPVENREMARQERIEMAAALEQELRRNFERELAGLPHGPQVKIGIFAISEAQGAFPGAPYRNAGTGNGTIDYFLFGGEEPSCVVAMAVMPDIRSSEGHLKRGPWWYSDASVPTNILGSCYYYAAYGVPGGRIDSWLDAGAMEYTSERSPHRQPSTISPRGRRMPLGIRGWGSVVIPAGEQCLSGHEERCADALLSKRSLALEENEATVAEHPEFLRRDHPYGGFFDMFMGKEAQLLSDLELEFGAERFRAFWTSDEPVELAFAEAFGMPAGAWMERWLEARFEPIRLGPGLDLPTLLYSLAFIAFCMGSVFATAQRRTVA